jgi:hypothetical protein
LKGRAKVTINGVSQIVTNNDGECTFRKYDVHDFCRADGGKTRERAAVVEEDGEVVVEEWTDPGNSISSIRKWALTEVQRMGSRKFSSFVTCTLPSPMSLT